MSFILKMVRPASLQNWIAANASGSLKPTARESWFAYLSANSGVGKTLTDMETSFLRAAGATGGTLHDLWSNYASVSGAAGTKNKEKIRNLYK